MLIGVIQRITEFADKDVLISKYKKALARESLITNTIKRTILQAFGIGVLDKLNKATPDEMLELIAMSEFATEQLGSDIGPIVGTILSILGYIAAAGGIAVIVGAIIVAMDHYKLGKFVIMLGAGLGLIGLIIMLITGIIAGTAVEEVTGIVSTIINGSYGFAGVLLTILSRRKLKKD